MTVPFKWPSTAQMTENAGRPREPGLRRGIVPPSHAVGCTDQGGKPRQFKVSFFVQLHTMLHFLFRYWSAGGNCLRHTRISRKLRASIESSKHSTSSH